MYPLFRETDRSFKINRFCLLTCSESCKAYNQQLSCGSCNFIQFMEALSSSQRTMLWRPARKVASATGLCSAPFHWLLTRKFASSSQLLACGVAHFGLGLPAWTLHDGKRRIYHAMCALISLIVAATGPEPSRKTMQPMGPE